MQTVTGPLSRPVSASRSPRPWRVGSVVQQNEQARIRVTLLGLVVFVAGLGAALKINLVGEIYVSELVLLLLLLVALPMGLPKLKGNRIFAAVLVASAMTMFGYILSDMVRGTSEAQYLRGWARNAMVVTSIIVLCALAARDRRTLWWFLLGMAVGSIAFFEIVQRLPMRAPQYWKFNYAMNVSLLLGCMAAFLPRRVVAILFVLLGVFSVTKDFRIHGAICVLVGALLWAVGGTDRRRALTSMLKVGAVGTIGILAALVLVNLTKDDYTEQRRANSNVGRLLGIQVGLAAIANAPIIGYGSWPTDPELVRISREVTREHEARTGRSAGEEVITNAHSQILNAWLEGGIFGAALFGTVLVLLFWGCFHGLVRRVPDLFTPLIALVLFMQVWNLVMSPLGSAGRSLFAVSVALIVMIACEQARAQLRPRHATVGSLRRR